MNPEVLQVITSTDRRGAEVFALDLGRELGHLGHRVRTVALAPGRSGGLDVPTLGRRPLAPSTLRALRRTARSAAVVVGHGSSTMPACTVALIGTGVPFVYRNIGDPRYWSSTWARRVRVRWMLRRAAAVVAVAAPAASALIDRFGVAPERITVIPTGASAARFAPFDAAARLRARARFGLEAMGPVAVFVGALSFEKDAALAIDTAGVSRGWLLLVVGDGPERDALVRRAAAVAPDRVHFAGSLPDPRPAYAAADVVLLTSRTEALPAALIEAGLQGLPVVACDVGYVREIVVDGETGIVAAEREPGVLAAALDRALHQGRALGAAARLRCRDRYELRAVASRWSEVLGHQRARRTEGHHGAQ